MYMSVANKLQMFIILWEAENKHIKPAHHQLGEETQLG